MSENKHYTNEDLTGKFNNNFKLVSYAILLAENMINTGRDSRVKRKDTQNRAMLILEEIREGKDFFDEIIADEERIDQDYNNYERRPVVQEIKADTKKNVPLEVDDR